MNYPTAFLWIFFMVTAVAGVAVATTIISPHETTGAAIYQEKGVVASPIKFTSPIDGQTVFQQPTVFTTTCPPEAATGQNTLDAKKPADLNWVTKATGTYSNGFCTFKWTPDLNGYVNVRAKTALKDGSGFISQPITITVQGAILPAQIQQTSYQSTIDPQIRIISPTQNQLLTEGRYFKITYSYPSSYAANCIPLEYKSASESAWNVLTGPDTRSVVGTTTTCTVTWQPWKIDTYHLRMNYQYQGVFRQTPITTFSVRSKEELNSQMKFNSPGQNAVYRFPYLDVYNGGTGVYTGYMHSYIRTEVSVYVPPELLKLTMMPTIEYIGVLGTPSYDRVYAWTEDLVRPEAPYNGGGAVFKSCTYTGTCTFEWKLDSTRFFPGKYNIRVKFPLKYEVLAAYPFDAYVSGPLPIRTTDVDDNVNAEYTGPYR